eukprot:CAMPEP_0168557022 /NCGR_PEP_ID=MMETSP0413-20121227/9196_1 /TAXON_ID=136452 /ORGANISM="Filamoeba nolandi, Strain NC-AS-23-1" /LENGTH=538 /DNA_ID=CAMNT_0008588011 /DNA_START=98 /DNA_END=1711 /DNA_ORIENTATION=-
MQDQLQEDLEDNPYFEYTAPKSKQRKRRHSHEGEDQDDDFIPQKLLKSKQKSDASAKKEKQTEPKTDNNQKKDKKPRKESVKWSDEEEKLFLEGLELHGRDWDKVVEHVKTRDKFAIKSHAQKHFIKLWKQNLPLPLKVQESGSGHTLSGKPLDPNSGAAQMYLGLKKKSNPQAQPDKPTEESLTNTANGEPSKSPSEPAKSPKRSKEKKKPLRESDVLTPEQLQSMYDESGRTHYAKHKLRDGVRQSQNTDQDPLTMVKCNHFEGEIASGKLNSQPFVVKVHSNVLFMIEFHAHLSTAEVIGFLGGTWDDTKKVLTIHTAFPCKSLATTSDMVNVEMDPESELEVREQIQANSLRVVGWYHSHPTFQPDPSLRDIENQSNYQLLFKDSTVEPFVGIIISPYDIRMPTEESILNWFYIRNSDQGNRTPMYLEHEMVLENAVPKTVIDAVQKLIMTFKDARYRTNFEEVWRYCRPIGLSGSTSDGQQTPANGSAIQLNPLTRLQKLELSLKHRVPTAIPANESQSLINKIIDDLQATWN